MKGLLALKLATALAPCQPPDEQTGGGRGGGPLPQVLEGVDPRASSLCQTDWEAQGPSGAYAQNDKLSSFTQDWGPWGHETFWAGTGTTGHPVSCPHTEVRGSPFLPRPPQLPHNAFYSEAVTLQRFIFTY